MITVINQSKTLKKRISCKCECKFDGSKCNSNQKLNSNNCLCECKNLKKNIICAKKLYLLHVVAKLVNIDSVIMCDEIINVRENISTNVTSTVSTYLYNKNLRYKTWIVLFCT